MNMVNETQWKGKVLFLHGFSQSANFFYRKTSAIRDALEQRGYKAVYLNGPHKLVASDIGYWERSSASDFEVDEVNGVVFRAWWLFPLPNQHVAYDITAAMETIKRYVDYGEIVQNDGSFMVEETEPIRLLPVSGVVTFSQGSGLCTLLCKNFERLFQHELKFMIMFSPYLLNMSENSPNKVYEEFYPDDLGESLKCKILAIAGELDTMVEPSETMQAVKRFEKVATYMSHPSGHAVPRSKLFINKMTEWLDSVLTEHSRPSYGEKSKSNASVGLSKVSVSG